MRRLADDCPVAAPTVAVQFFDGLDDADPEGIEVDVADKGRQIVVFVTEDGFTAIFKKVAGALYSFRSECFAIALKCSSRV